MATKRQLSEEDKQKVLDQHGRSCFVDGEPFSEDEPIEFHHIKPFSLGGPTALDNIAPVCKRHHRTIGTMSLQEGDDTHCEDCAVTMGAGGSAHSTAEETKEKRRKRKGTKATVKLFKKELQEVCKRLKALTKKMERVTRAADKLEKAQPGTKDRRRKKRETVKTGTLTKEFLDQQRDWIENYLGLPVCSTCRHHLGGTKCTFRDIITLDIMAGETECSHYEPTQ